MQRIEIIIESYTEYRGYIVYTYLYINTYKHMCTYMMGVLVSFRLRYWDKTIYKFEYALNGLAPVW